jgi:hypothetical protein
MCESGPIFTAMIDWGDGSTSLGTVAETDRTKNPDRDRLVCTGDDRAVLKSSGERC